MMQFMHWFSLYKHIKAYKNENFKLKMWVWYTSMSSGDKTLVTCYNMWAVILVLYCDIMLLAYIESQVAIANI